MKHKGQKRSHGKKNDQIPDKISNRRIQIDLVMYDFADVFVHCLEGDQIYTPQEILNAFIRPYMSIDTGKDENVKQHKAIKDKC